MTRFGFRTLALLTGLLAASVGPVSEVSASETVTIGFTAALSGDFAAFGLNMRKGLDLALEDLNASGATKFEVVSADDRGQPNEGALIAQRFCDNKSIQVVMGYSFSSVALAAVPIYDRCGLPVLASAVGSPQLSGSSKYFHRNLLTDAIQGAMMGTYSVKKVGAKRIYMIYQQDDYGIGVKEAFKKAAIAAGASIVGEDNYVLGTKDFKTQLTKAREANPDALFIGGFYAEAAKIADQSKALGLNVTLLGTDGALNPELMKLAGPAVEGMYLFGMFDPSVQTANTEKFLTAYRAKYKEDPNAWAALAYDAAYTVAEAVKIAGSTGNVSRESINSAFAKIKDLKGVTGPTTFNAGGDREGELYFLKVTNGKFQLAN